MTAYSAQTEWSRRMSKRISAGMPGFKTLAEKMEWAPELAAAEVGTRAINCLVNAGYRTGADVRAASDLKLLLTGECGPLTLKRIRAAFPFQEPSNPPPVPDWLPTPENVNALPEPLRIYIQRLETECDPSGTVRENVLLRDQVRALEKLLGK